MGCFGWRRLSTARVLTPVQAGYTDWNADDIGEFGFLVILFSNYKEVGVRSLPYRGGGEVLLLR